MVKIVQTRRLEISSKYSFMIQQSWSKYKKKNHNQQGYFFIQKTRKNMITVSIS